MRSMGVLLVLALLCATPAVAASKKVEVDLSVGTVIGGKVWRFAPRVITTSSKQAEVTVSAADGRTCRVDVLPTVLAGGKVQVALAFEFHNQKSVRRSRMKVIVADGKAAKVNVRDSKGRVLVFANVKVKLI